MVTVDDVRHYVRATTSDDPDLERALLQAESMLTNYLGAEKAGIPEDEYDPWVLHLTSELWNRQNAPGGVSNFATLDGEPFRLARDPMTALYPLMSKWKLYGV